MKIQTEILKKLLFSSTTGKLLILSAGLFLTEKLFAGINLRKARTESVYEQDRKMPLRKSQDNPMVKQIYKDFLEHPNSHKSHELLHTDYTDRSAGVKNLRLKGIKI